MAFGDATVAFNGFKEVLDAGHSLDKVFELAKDVDFGEVELLGRVNSAIVGGVLETELFSFVMLDIFVVEEDAFFNLSLDDVDVLFPDSEFTGVGDVLVTGGYHLIGDFDEDGGHSLRSVVVARNLVDV